ncbi:MAG TPA: ATP-dependent zinc metalloprotease FtsH [Candidatus Saccharimonadales bacterium]|nr:ATP-dependent zinc metalloprotease FtsH [Candidatus Saccharimonadales bacterium]
MKATTKPKKNYIRMLGFYLLLLLAASFLIYGLAQPSFNNDQKPISDSVNAVKAKEAKQILIDGNTVTTKLKNSTEFKSTKEDNESYYQILDAAKVDPGSTQIITKDNSTTKIVYGLLNLLLPVIVLVGLFYFFFRQARGQGDSLLSFGRSKAKQFNKDKEVVKFTDVAGVDEAKQELTEVVEFLKTPEKFRALGAKIPKGVLLVGPAGVGKTLLARAVAGEAGVPFYSIAGSEFMEMLVGVGASRVRDLFENAKKSAPAIIFIDEIDSIGRQRGLGIGGGHDEREQTLNQILVEMDGFEANANVIVMGATNRPDMLDPALVRPGRFDRRVSIDLPDITGRREIIDIHSKGKPMGKEVDLDRLARRTVGFSGADIANMLNEASILAARENKKEIDNVVLEEAATKVQLGPQRKRLTSDDEKKITAYHEAGHAVVSKILPHTDPVHRISIISRGATGGHTLIPPAFDRYLETKTRLLETIASLLGGRAAEEIEFKDFSIGAASDIERATSVARNMVTKFGMSSLGPMTTGTQGENPWIAREVGDGRALSEELAAKVDEEVKRIMDEQFEVAKKILTENKDKLDLVAEELIKKETLEGDEFEVLMTKIEKKAPKPAAEKTPEK